MDLDTLKIRVRLRFPKLHFEGDYKLDAQVLIVPLKGEGQLNADAGEVSNNIFFWSDKLPFLVLVTSSCFYI